MAPRLNGQMLSPHLVDHVVEALWKDQRERRRTQPFNGQLSLLSYLDTCPLAECPEGPQQDAWSPW